MALFLYLLSTVSSSWKVNSLFVSGYFCFAAANLDYCLRGSWVFEGCDDIIAWSSLVCSGREMIGESIRFKFWMLE